jgi:hypothetical protein
MCILLTFQMSRFAALAVESFRALPELPWNSPTVEVAIGADSFDIQGPVGEVPSFGDEPNRRACSWSPALALWLMLVVKVLR